MRYYFVLCLLFALTSLPHAYCQSDIAGSWQGVFMKDFRAQIVIRPVDQDLFDGQIRLFSNGSIIQDDKLDHIRISNRLFSFYIPAKETTFEGTLNEDANRIEGEFLFPDGSRHPIQLTLQTDEFLTAEIFSEVKSTTLAVDDMHSDITELYKTLGEYHPQLYTFTSKDSLDQIYHEIVSSIDTALTTERFYARVAKLADAIRCSHTGAQLPSRHQVLADSFGNHLPLKLYFTNGRAYLISTLHNPERLALGSEILAINDKSIREIIREVFAYIPSEGCNSTTKYREINRKFNSLYYLVDDTEAFRIQFRHGKVIDNINVPACRLADLEFDSDSHEENSNVTIEYFNNRSAAFLKVSSFAITDMDHYMTSLDSIFRDLRSLDIPDLVLDLRDNSGGHPIFAAQLLSYLTKREYTYFRRINGLPEFEPLYNAMEPNSLNFNGKVYVLVNGGCLSTTGHLISLLKDRTDARFVGEDPGSTFRCNDFSTQVTLTNSGIVVNVPRVTFETAVSGFKICEPFPLDTKINVDISDVITKKDPYLDTVMSMLDGRH